MLQCHRQAPFALRQHTLSAATSQQPTDEDMLSRLLRFHRPIAPTACFQLNSTSASTRYPASIRAMSSSAPAPAPFIVMDPFCLRSFAPSHSSSTYINSSADDFVQRVNSHYQQQLTSTGDDNAVLKAGYAPFCKHIFMPNHINELHSAYLPITDDNKQFLQSASRHPHLR